MKPQNERYMRRAIELATGNVRAGRGGPFGAVVVRDGHVVAEGVNLVTSANDPTAHAEMTAIREACRKLGRFRLDDCDLYTSCEPCPMCLGAVYWSRLRQVLYASTKDDAAEIGFDDSIIYDQFLLPHAHRSIPQRQLLRDEALSAFRAWREKTDRIAY
jgi:guanine deaminase